MLVEHPEANLVREHMFKYGIGYCPTMDYLMICRSATKDELVTGCYVASYTPSLAVDLLLHPNDQDRVIGAKYISVANMIVFFGINAIPRPCEATFFADLIDRWFHNESDGLIAVTQEKKERAVKAHTKAQFFAKEFGTIPEEVLLSIEKTVDTIRAKRLSRLH
jgi:hypothetical protein